MQVFVQAAASGAGRPISEVFPGIEAQLPPAEGAASEARNSAAETVKGACLEAEVSWPAKASPELPRAASIRSSRTMAHLFMLSSFQKRAPVHSSDSTTALLRSLDIYPLSGSAVVLSPGPSTAPRFHAFTKRVRRVLYAACAWFVASFRAAAEKVRAGVLSRNRWHLKWQESDRAAAGPQFAEAFRRDERQREDR